MTKHMFKLSTGPFEPLEARSTSRLPSHMMYPGHTEIRMETAGHLNFEHFHFNNMAGGKVSSLTRYHSSDVFFACLNRLGVLANHPVRVEDGYYSCAAFTC